MNLLREGGKKGGREKEAGAGGERASHLPLQKNNGKEASFQTHKNIDWKSDSVLPNFLYDLLPLFLLFECTWKSVLSAILSIEAFRAFFALFFSSPHLKPLRNAVLFVWDSSKWMPVCSLVPTPYQLQTREVSVHTCFALSCVSALI